jgi:hypothetical protein
LAALPPIEEAGLQAGGHLDLPELGAHGSLKSSVLIEPAPQFRVTARQLQGFGDPRVGRVGDAGPIEQQNFSGFRAFHAVSLFTLPGAGVFRSSSSLNWAEPRAMRDFFTLENACKG